MTRTEAVQLGQQAHHCSHHQAVPTCIKLQSTSPWNLINQAVRLPTPLPAIYRSSCVIAGP